MDFFWASTKIQLGDGNKPLLWHDAWLPDGSIAKLRWPILFDISTRKNHSVRQELTAERWIRSLGRIATPLQLAAFIDMSICIRGINLSDTPDTISWRWTPSGSYSAASAYKAQFLGSFPPFIADKVWKARAEPKIRFFAWTLLHGKILTADNLALRGWTHNPICQLCRIHPETIAHLCRDCSYTSEVWRLVKNWSSSTSLVIPAAPPFGRLLAHPLAGALWCSQKDH